MYRESFDFALASKEKPPRKYLVLYQTEFEDALKSNEFLNVVRQSSEMWSDNKKTTDIGDFNVRNYKLIQDYDPDGKGESKFLPRSRSGKPNCC